MRPVVGVTCGSIPEGGRLALDLEYVEALCRAGAVPFVIAPGLPEEALPEVLESLDGLLLSGGPDVDPAHFGEDPLPAMGRIDPGRDGVELPLARLALGAGLPILGICRGAQVLNIAAGGDIYQDLPSQLPGCLGHVQQPTPMTYPTHGLEVRDDSLLCAITMTTGFRVNSWHHQAVRKPAPGFAVTATAPDGVAEAIEKPGAPFVLGVQFHPESMAKGGSREAGLLFEAFVRACSKKQPG